MDNRNFDYDKSTDVRFRKMKSLVDAFEIEQSQVYNEPSNEWVVTTNLTVWKGGFKKQSVGRGSMSTKDDKLGWAALPYASTTSLGRAISLLGLFGDDIATETEVEEASERVPQRKIIQDTKELMQAAKDFVDQRSPAKDIKEQAKEMDKEVEMPKPSLRRVKHKHKKTEIEQMSMTDIIKLADSLTYGQYKIKASDLPMRTTKGNLFDVIYATEEGLFLEKAREIIAEYMQKNVDKGLAADSGISAYLLEKFDFTDKPDENLTSIKVESMLENFLEGNRDHLSFLQSIWEPLQNDGYSDSQLVRIFEKMKADGVFKFESVGMMFASSPVNDLRKYLHEVYKQKPI